MAKDDLISKNDLLLSLAEYVNSNAYLNQTALDALLMVMRWVNEDPAVDAVPVVRCRECRHRGDPDECPMLCEVYYGFETERYDRSEDDGFCHRGAKMHGGETDD